MTAELLKGAPVAARLNEQTKKAAARLAEQGVTATLAILRVGDRPDDVSYEKSSTKRCESLGISVKSVVLPEDAAQSELMSCIAELNADETVHGILMLRPLPKHLDEEAACDALLPEKDVDGVTDSSLAGVFTASGRGFCPCTAHAAAELLDYYGIDCEGKNVVIIGRSLVVGRPLAMLLMHKNATVTICHTRTKELPSVTRRADMIVATAGRPKMIKAEHLSPGQILIDVGINVDENGVLCGDVDAEEAVDWASALTPVPGGVGTVTTSILAANVVKAAQNSVDGGGL